MKITVLVENNSKIDRYLLSEPALSLLIEEGNKKILFDCGYSDIFLSNAQKLNIDLSDITNIIISHGHDDHTGGLKYLAGNNNVSLLAHPNIFDKKTENGISYSCPLSEYELSQKFRLNLSKKPVKISEKLYFLGEIKNNNSEDIDDSAIAYISDKGLLIITGCSHAGVKNIINQAKEITGVNKIYGIFGGLHLLNKQKSDIKELSEFLKKENIEYIAPCHCCDLKSKILLSQYFPIEEICTGDIINFPKADS